MTGRFGVIAAGTLLAMGAQAAGDPLGAYRWTSRVLVLAAPDPGDARLKAQREALSSVRRGTAERDLVVIEAVGPGAEATALRGRLGIPASAFRAVLVGKDGGAKLSSPEPIAPQTLFSTIDAMPMRRDELKRRKTPFHNGVGSFAAG